MKKFNLQSIIRKKNSSYKGQTRRIADNHVKRDFEATAPNQKWFTDVTEFNLRGEKLYLSPILDAYGRYLEELKETIEDYIYYYNNKRIKEKLKGLTPASYRSQSLLVS